MRYFKIGLLGLAPLLFARLLQAQDSSTVFLGGAGPAPYFQGAIDKIADSLKSDGVKVKVAAGDRSARTALLDQAKTEGYKNLLYVTLHRPIDSPSRPARGDVTAECFVSGNKVWAEKSKSPLVFPGSTEHEMNSMISGLVKKIGKRAGGPCLAK
jgi:hypothetical protein